MPSAKPPRPDNDTLRRLAQELSRAEIAQRYGRTRQAVDSWMHELGEPPRRPHYIYRAPDGFTPWTPIHPDHHKDSIGRALRVMEKMRLGAENIPATDRNMADKLLRFIRQHDVVVRYCGDPEAVNDAGESIFGYTFPPRDPAIDAPGDIIRRP